MEHTISQYAVSESGIGMVEVSAYLTHKGVFEVAEWVSFRTSREEWLTAIESGLDLPIECPACGEVIQMPSVIVNEEGFLQISPEGIEELEERGIEWH